LPPGIAVLHFGCLRDCAALEEVTFAESSGLREIGMFAFSGTAIRRMDVPDSVVKIGESAFFGCERLREVVLTEESGLRVIGPRAFGNSGVVHLRIPDVDEIGGGAMPAHCQLEIDAGNSALVEWARAWRQDKEISYIKPRL
jgi:hypothetical protein